MASSDATGQDGILAILERLPISVVISDFATGSVLWTNAWNIGIVAASSTHELVGRNLLEFIPPEEHGRALEAIEAVSAGRSPGALVYRIRKLDGTMADAQISSAVIRFDGKPAMLSLLSDVTDREQATRDLAESEERYRLLVEASPDGIVVCVDDEIVYANPALLEVLGAETADRVIGRRMFDFIESTDHKHIREGKKKLLMTKEPRPPMPVALRSLDGTPLLTTIRSSLVRWKGLHAVQTLVHIVEDSE